MCVDGCWVGGRDEQKKVYVGMCVWRGFPSVTLNCGRSRVAIPQRVLNNFNSNAQFGASNLASSVGNI